MALTITYNAPLTVQTGLSLSAIAGTLPAATYYIKIISTNKTGSWLSSAHCHSPSAQSNITLASPGGIRLTWTNTDARHAYTHIFIKSGTGSWQYYRVAGGYNGTTGATYDMTSWNVYASYPFVENCLTMPFGFNNTSGCGEVAITGSSGDVTPAAVAAALAAAGATNYYWDGDRNFAMVHCWNSSAATGGTFTITGKVLWIYGGFFNSALLQITSTRQYSSLSSIGVPCQQGGWTRFNIGMASLKNCWIGEGKVALTGQGYGGQQFNPGSAAVISESIIGSQYAYISYASNYTNTTFVSGSVYDMVNDAVNNVMDIRIFDGYLYLYYSTRNSIFRNLLIRTTGNYDLAHQEIGAGWQAYKHIIIDGLFPLRTDNIPVVQWYSANGMNPVELKFSVNIKVLDAYNNPISGATVKMTNTNGATVINTTTSASGVITEQFVIRTTLAHKAGSGNGYGAAYTDQVNYNPFTLEIRAAGWETYRSTMTITDKFNMQITLQRASVQVDQEVL